MKKLALVWILVLILGLGVVWAVEIRILQNHPRGLQLLS
jgi:hypothetical protein